MIRALNFWFLVLLWPIVCDAASVKYTELTTNTVDAAFGTTNVVNNVVAALNSSAATNTVSASAPSMAAIVALINSGGGGGNGGIYTYAGNPLGIVAGQSSVNLCWDSLNKLWWVQVGTGTGGWAVATPSYTSFDGYYFQQYGYSMRLNPTNYADKPTVTNIVLSLTVSNSAALSFTNTGNVFVGNFTGNGSITNGGAGGPVWYVTNNTPTLAYPNGSICTVTDGRFYVRTNAAWVQK